MADLIDIINMVDNRFSRLEQLIGLSYSQFVRQYSPDINIYSSSGYVSFSLFKTQAIKKLTFAVFFQINFLEFNFKKFLVYTPLPVGDFALTLRFFCLR